MSDLIKTVHQFLRGNKSAWDTSSNKNKVLKDGEPGFERDTGGLKIGDGQRTWGNLPYLTIRQGTKIEDENIIYIKGAEIFNNVSNQANGVNSHSEGANSIANGSNSHVEGSGSIANGNNSHAEGNATRSNGVMSHTEGYNTHANGSGSHAEGNGSIANANYSHASGSFTIGMNENETVVGKYNNVTIETTGEGDQTTTTYKRDTNQFFTVGKGTASVRSDAFYVDTNGNAYVAAGQLTPAADYAEYFEWADGNPEAEDRRGYFVTLEDGKIRKATSVDIYILGIVSATPSVLGNAAVSEWHNRYMKDVYGAILYEEIWIPEDRDEEGNIIQEAHYENQPILNPEYDATQPYIGRDKRPEWAPIGMLGQLITNDDGTCIPNTFCSVNDNGEATYSIEKTDYYVIERLDDNHIKVLVK